MIELRGIRKSYGSRVILADLDLVVQRGRCIGLVGPNGSGKSTLLAIMAGALKADGGTIRYNDRPMTTREDLSRWAAFVPQDNPLIDELTVRDNLKLWYAGTGASLADALRDGLPRELGLDRWLSHRVRNLSGGLKKRVSIACALANDAPILLMDEPGASLDLLMKQDIRRHLQRYLDRGGTIVISSHEEDELKMCHELHHLTRHHLERLPAGISGDALTDYLIRHEEGGNHHD